MINSIKFILLFTSMFLLAVTFVVGIKAEKDRATRILLLTSMLLWFSFLILTLITEYSLVQIL